MKRGDKKAMQLAISTIVIIVISVLVLIALLLIWNQQTGVFSDFLENLMGRSNVDAVIAGCNTLVSQDASYEYCCVDKNVKYGDREEDMTCFELAKQFDKINNIDCGGIC